MALPRGDMGLSAVCDCDISLSYLLTIFVDHVPGSRKIALTQASEMQQTSTISINLIQPEPDYNP